jgi:penicillin amidase
VTCIAAALAASCQVSPIARDDGAPGAAPAPSDSAITVAGLDAPVRVVTDRHGIPHLEAATLADVYFAWGWVTARDRGWQIAQSRQSARGELWHWVGNRALRGDGGAQLFRLRERADSIWARDRARPEVRVPLERYAAGVNAWFDACRRGERPWPAELRALAAVPEPWLPQDAILIQLAQGFVLDFLLPEIDEAAVMSARGADWFERRERFESALEVNTIPDSVAQRIGRPIVPDTMYAAHPGAARAGTVAARRPAPAIDAARPGRVPAIDHAVLRRALAASGVPVRHPDERASDIFAVGPLRSASGKPLLANDPHLPLADPGPLHVVHLRVPGLVDAGGAAVPGLPVIASGRNRECAWGLTALSADVIDVYADSLSRDGRRVRVGEAWFDVVQRPFTMRYRLPGGGTMALPGQARRYGPHGPIVALDRKRGVAIAVRWAGEDSAITLAGLLGIERSRGAEEVAARVRTTVTPTLHIVAADVGGRVIYQTCGAVPRRGFAPSHGFVPSDGRHEWEGLIPPDEMPAWRVPPGGFVVNGNNQPIADGHPDDWPRFEWPHDRAARMTARLRALPRVTPGDMASIQNDVHSLDAARILPLLIGRAREAWGRLNDEERAAVELLETWNLAATRERVGPTLYHAWYGALRRRSKLGDLHGLAAAALDGRAPEALAHPVSGARETAADAAVAALRIALARLRAEFGRDPSGWTYGTAHRARFPHALAWRNPRWQGAATPFDGDRSTPSVGRSRLPWTEISTHAPVFRHVVDLAVPDSSHVIVPPGNSGVRGSPHATDHLARWANHAYVTLHLDSAGVASVTESVTRLVPKR